MIRRDWEKKAQHFVKYLFASFKLSFTVYRKITIVFGSPYVLRLSQTLVRWYWSDNERLMMSSVHKKFHFLFPTRLMPARYYFGFRICIPFFQYNKFFYFTIAYQVLINLHSKQDLRLNESRGKKIISIFCDYAKFMYLCFFWCLRCTVYRYIHTILIKPDARDAIYSHKDSKYILFYFELKIRIKKSKMKHKRKILYVALCTLIRLDKNRSNRTARAKIKIKNVRDCTFKSYDSKKFARKRMSA